jgi:hypothetical protein
MDSIPDEVIEIVPIDLILPAALGPGVHLARNRNECQKIFVESKARPVL